MPVAGGGDRDGFAGGIDEAHSGAAFDGSDRGDRELKLRREGTDAIAGVGWRGKQQLVIIAGGGEPRRQVRSAGDEPLYRRRQWQPRQRDGRADLRGLADMAEIGDETVGYIAHPVGDAGEEPSELV